MTYVDTHSQFSSNTIGRISVLFLEGQKQVRNRYGEHLAFHIHTFIVGADMGSLRWSVILVSLIPFHLHVGTAVLVGSLSSELTGKRCQCTVHCSCRVFFKKLKHSQNPLSKSKIAFRCPSQSRRKPKENIGLVVALPKTYPLPLLPTGITELLLFPPRTKTN